MSLEEQPISIPSRELTLDGRLHEGTRDLAAVVLHPHPQYGGDMDNHVVIAVCETLASLGATTLRYNSRGTGASGGSYDSGRGETEDAVAAVAFVEEKAPGARVVLVGYSFGAMVAARAASGVPLAALVLISPPRSAASLDDVSPDVPVLVVTGSRDGVSPPADALALSGPGRAVRVVENADHGWWPGVDELCDELRRFVQPRLG